MAKHIQSEVKKPDKFLETLTAAWSKAEPYALRVGLAAGALLAIIGIWIAIGRGGGRRDDAAWAKHFALGQKAGRAAAEAETDEDRQKVTQQLLADMKALVEEYDGQPVAAATLLETSQLELGLAGRARTDAPAEAKEHFRRAAEAAEKFLTTFPAEHALAPLAAYNAGNARLQLEDYQTAAKHFARCGGVVGAPGSVRVEPHGGSPIAALAALARLHTARCYEKLGRTADARRLYQTLRKDRWAGWAAQQAEYRLSQLDKAPPKGS